MAHALAKVTSDKARLEGDVPAAIGETSNEWFGRYNKYQSEVLKHSDAPTKATRWNKWAAKRIGHKPPDEVTRDDIEDIRDELDTAIDTWMLSGGKRAGRKSRAVSGVTAMNAWTCVTSSFKAMTSSKRRDLRVLEGKPNPCVGVEPPGNRDSRKSRRKPFLFPRECDAILACKEIPIEWRIVYALAFYLYLRPSELRVLTMADIAAGLVHVTKAWDYENEVVKVPKTRNGVRKIPSPAMLLPLLEYLKDGAEPTALVVPLLASFGEDHLAEQFRAHLLVAGVDRAELHETTLTHAQAVFRSCRDSGITWLAMTGLGVDKICRRAGHDMVQTTMGYVKMAEDLTGDLGVPFGPLPDDLLDAPKASPKPPDGSGGVSVFRLSRTNDCATLLSGRRDSNPRRPHLGKRRGLRFTPLRPVTSSRNHTPDPLPERSSRYGQVGRDM